MAPPSRVTAASRFGLRSRAYFRYVFQKIAVLTIGAIFVSRAGEILRAAVNAHRRPARKPAVRAAVVAHLYYLDLLPEILGCHATLPEGSPLHLTVPHDRSDDAFRLIEGMPAVTIHPCQNRGRDIAPFLGLLNAGTFDGYDAVLKLHTKRSPHLLDGEIRRKLLYTMLVGERNRTRKTLALFEAADTGLVGWSACYRNASPYWMGNEARVRAIAARMHAPHETIQLGFFEGSMFWFRPAALKRLRDLQLTPEDFEPEAHQLDGTLHHALERCFTISAWADKFLVRGMKGEILRSHANLPG